MTSRLTIPGGTHTPVDASDGFTGTWVSLGDTELYEGVRFRLEDGHRWFALERYRPWWLRPSYGRDSGTNAGEYVQILAEYAPDHFVVVLPVTDGGVRTVLRGDSEGWYVRAAGTPAIGHNVTSLLVAEGGDPISLVRWAMARLAEEMKTFTLREQKTIPKWVDTFGWCTWDAFYREVSSANVIKGLESFAAGGISPRFLFLDDGWQDTEGDYLRSFGPDPVRFPGGLSPLVAEATSRFPLEQFGVWHPVQGSWSGILEGSELANNYRLVRVNGPARDWPQDDRDRRAVHPDDAGRYLSDYHSSLSEQGVTLIKVDNQAVLDHFTPEGTSPGAMMKAYQQALQESTTQTFAGESLYCMSNSTDVAYRLSDNLVWRSSRDFYPKRIDLQGQHIYNNVTSAVWIHTFALPDWDMFQSGHPWAWFHAAARAISGGPIYVSDPTGTQDFDLLARLVVRDDRILRSAQPALPAKDSLFIDGRAAGNLTKIVNYNIVPGLSSPIGVIGLFNCAYVPEGTPDARGEFRATDVPEITEGEVAYLDVVSEEVLVGGANEAQPVAVSEGGFRVMTASPVVDGIATFGLLEKFNGSRAIEQVERVSTGVLVQLMDGGRFGWFARDVDVTALVDGVTVPVHRDGELSWVEVPQGGAAQVELRTPTSGP